MVIIMPNFYRHYIDKTFIVIIMPIKVLSISENGDAGDWWILDTRDWEEQRAEDRRHRESAIRK